MGNLSNLSRTYIEPKDDWGVFHSLRWKMDVQKFIAQRLGLEKDYPGVAVLMKVNKLMPDCLGGDLSLEESAKCLNLTTDSFCDKLNELAKEVKAEIYKELDEVAELIAGDLK